MRIHLLNRWLAVLASAGLLASCSSTAAPIPSPATTGAENGGSARAMVQTVVAQTAAVSSAAPSASALLPTAALATEDTTPTDVVAPTLVPSPESSVPPPTPVSTVAASANLALPAGLPSAQVVRVIDGDTLDVSLNGSTERVRLIGIDTPETKHPSRPVECFGREASAQAEALLTGQTVQLEEDLSQDSRDSYGRLLRYVWLADGRMVNYELVAQGYAFEYTYNLPYRYQAQFQAAQRQAREAQWGLWAPTACNGQQIPADQAPLAVPPPTDLPVAPAVPPPTDLPVAPAVPPTDIPPAPVDPAPSASGAVAIIALDKREETVTLQNTGAAAVSLDGWTIVSIKGNQRHATLSGSLAPGEQRLIPSQSGRAIWNNSERDDAALYDAAGNLISYWNDTR